MVELKSEFTKHNDTYNNFVTNKAEHDSNNNAKRVNIVSNSSDNSLIIDDYTTPNITYFGYAEVGSNTNEAVWKIKIIDETGNYPIWKYAEGNTNFDNIFDNRVGLSYS